MSRVSELSHVIPHMSDPEKLNLPMFRKAFASSYFARLNVGPAVPRRVRAGSRTGEIVIYLSPHGARVALSPNEYTSYTKWWNRRRRLMNLSESKRRSQQMATAGSSRAVSNGAGVSP
jgi:hypothetical protein